MTEFYLFPSTNASRSKVLRLYLTSIMMFVLTASAFAQSKITVTGVVTYKDGSPIPGVSIILKDTKTGVSSDFDGKYSIEVPPNGTLQFSYLGFKTKLIPVNGKNSINTILEESAEQLNEIVVVGYGSLERSNVTGSISTIQADVIGQAPVANPIESLRGEVAGLRVTRGTGEPGSGVNFLIRGDTSLSGGSAPLVVVDGVPISTGVSSINPDDIESITLLKDNAAAAIYGASSGNGVVLIQTKKGKSGKATFSVDMSSGITNLVREPTLMNSDQFVQFRIDALKGDEAYDGSFIGVANAGLDPNEVSNYIAGKSIDWQDLLIGIGTQNTYNFSVRAGTEKFKFYTNVGAYVEKGIIDKSDFNRYTFRINSSYQVSDKINIGANMMYTLSDQDRTGLGRFSASSNNLAFINYIGNSPVGDVYDADGNYAATVTDSQFQYNPLFRYQQSQIDVDRNSVLINPYFEYELLPGLNYKLNTSFENNARRSRRFYSSIYDDGTRSGAPRYIEWEEASDRNYLIDNIINYSKTFGDNHDLDVTVVYGYQSNEYDRVTLEGRGQNPEDPATYDLLGYHGLNTMTQDNTQTSSGHSDWARNYLVTRLNYSFADKYILTGTVRRDYSSRFPSANRVGWFPSASLAWNVHKEDFLSDSFLDLLKLRLSWGISGNDRIGTFDYLRFTNSAFYPVDGTIFTGLVASDRLGNTDLRWEQTEQANIGLDFETWNNRAKLTIDAYKNSISDLLLDESLPIISGGTVQRSNIGEMKAWGIEVGLNLNIIQPKEPGGFAWNINANWTLERQEILSLARNNVDADGNPQDDIGNGWFIGHPEAAYLQYVYDGVYQTDEEDIAASMHPNVNGYGAGDPKIKDVSGPDGVPDGIITEDDRIIFNPNPDWYGGLGNNFTYGDFSLDVLIEAVVGGDRVNSYLPTLRGGQGAGNRVMVDYWTPENTGGYYPEPNTDDNFGSEFNNAWKIRDATYFALRNVSLGYTITKDKLKNTGLNDIKLFVEGNNLFYVTPEFKESYSPEQFGFQFPITKIIVFGAKFTF